MRKVLICLAAALATSGLAAATRETPQQRGEAELAKELNGLVAGKPERCLSQSRVYGSRIIEGNAILYRVNGGKIYINRPSGAERLRDDDIQVQYVYGSQLCRMDRVKLLDRGTQGLRGFVVLGDFVPYSKPPAANDAQ